MATSIRFLMVLHNHQPIGNFDGVFEQAYQDSYLPFLDLFCEPQYESLRIALHTSGSLMEWLDAHHPEYVDRLAGLVATGRVEIVGGAFFEPILTMIRTRDRVGQIKSYSQWLEDRLGAKIRGMWLPERVWEQSLASDLVEAGINYTMLDDFHFKNAGLDADELHGYYTTEDDGRVLCVFPGNEPLRYKIPFAAPHETIDTLGEISQRHPGSVVMFADDGEKFGAWPETKKHVYDEGWLRQFFDLLCGNQHWIKITTPSEALDNVPPLGSVYLPEGSYREMTEWVLPTSKQIEYHGLRRDMEQQHHWPRIAGFVRGGYWRNFKTKYPESNEMYARGLMVSRRLEQAEQEEQSGALIEQARQELYRGQCNCSYWHGAFGGIYLPHLRNAVYEHLIAADKLLDQAAGNESSHVEAATGDFNFDARQEVMLRNGRLTALVAPASGGILYELDVHAICHNLLATLARRPESYHQKVLAGPGGNGDLGDIAERAVFKQEGLHERVAYDHHPRKSLIDHFYDNDSGLHEVRHGAAEERGDFVSGVFEARLRRNPDRIQLQLSREGAVDGHSIKITKGVTLAADQSMLEIAYLLENLPADRTLHFAPEFNFAGLPAGADDRYFTNHDGERLGQLGAQLDLADVRSLGLCDEWLGIDVRMIFNRPSHVWTYPIETVSQSEGGFELVHQSVVVQPHWYVRAEVEGSWSVTMHLELDTPRAENRGEEPLEAVTAS